MTALVRSLCLMGFLLAVLLGCKDKMCPANPLPEPWKPYASLIPPETVICGSNRGPQDNYPPTQLFVYFKKGDSAKAYEETNNRFKAAGWTLKKFYVIGETSTKSWNADYTKDGVEIGVMVNKNDFGIQGSFELKEKK